MLFTSSQFTVLCTAVALAASILTGSISECEALQAAEFGDRILLRGTDEYEDRLGSWWSVNNRLRPACIVQPRETSEVSRVVATLSHVKNARVAIRSGGHSQWAGGSNVEGGVTIDLGHLTSVSYNADTGVASIGPARRWGDVFSILEEDGVSVAGGRDGNVGVGGYVTGGGNSYYAGRQGFACDTLINAEVVLADGSVVFANASSNSDLWKALKGGSGNFGIVTRFDLTTFEARDLWKAVRIVATSETNAVVDSLVKFTNANDQFPEAALVLQWTHDLSVSPDLFIAQVFIDTDTVEFPESYESLKAIPAIQEAIEIQPQSEVANGNTLPGGRYNSWSTITVKNNVNVVRLSVELHETLVTELLREANPEAFTTKLIWQPIPKVFADIGQQRGGNVLGLDALDGNALMLLVYIQTNSSELDAIAQSKASQLTADIKSYAESIGATVPWLYINYASPDQDPVQSYGQDNIDFLERVSKKYDPNGFFQTNVVSGFKLR